MREAGVHGSRRIARGGLALVITALAMSAAPFRGPTYFDPAPGGIQRDAAVVLTPADTYDSSRGYGWTTPPAAAFALPEFSGVRAPALQDGVSGPEFTLRIDVAPGRWAVIAFLDDGYRDAAAVAIEANGRAVAHNPRAFGLEAEPPRPPINRYRVAQFVVNATGTLTLRFQAAGAGARVLALQCLPLEWPETDVTRWIRRQVEDAGRYDFRTPLDVLRTELTQRGRDPALAACCGYWRAQLDLLAEAEHWHAAGGWDALTAETRSSMFVRYKLAVALLDPLVEHPDGAAFPLHDRAQWLRARLLHWLWLEQHFATDDVTRREDLAALRARYPDAALIAMYAGDQVPAPAPRTGFRIDRAAPGWSIAEAEALQRLRDVAYYWIDERQIPNGEFGGKKDDDVELLRWWSLLMFTGDHKVREGFRRLAEGMWFSPRMDRGYSREPLDVEHSAEFVSDTLPLMALVTHEPAWLARLQPTYEHMRDEWTGRNARGDLTFKSAWLGATEVLSTPPRNRDVSYNARVAKVVRYHAALSGDPAARQLLHDWSLAWAAAAARTDKGKPAGLFPASVRWPDGAFNGDEPTWHRANMYWRYYDWTADGRLYDQLLFSWADTPDLQLLEPLQATLALLQDSAGQPPGPEGSRTWAAAQLLASPEFWGVVAQWRLESNDRRFDVLLARHGPPYLRYRITGDAAPLAAGIEQTLLSTLRYNRPMRTSEVLFTDRVFVATDDGNTDGTDLLAAMLTGCHSAEGLSPWFHVIWDAAPEGFTALVTNAGAARFSADIFLHQAAPATISARLLRLRAGRYRLTLTTGDEILVQRTEVIRGPNHEIAVPVPGARLVSLTLVPADSP